MKNLYSEELLNLKEDNSYQKIFSNLVKISRKLRNEIKEKKIAAIDEIYRNDDIKNFISWQKKIGKKKLIVIGVGGSSLGAKTISSLKENDNLVFLESIDPQTVKNFLVKLDYQNSFFLIISKSGETIETICQTLIIIEEFKKKKIKNFADNFLFVTETKNNSLTKIAKKIRSEMTEHSDKIGGRYSCFSIVGLLPALINGIDVKKIRNGAKKAVQNFLTSEEIIKSCAAQIYFYQNGFTSNVVMPYIDCLKNFTDWYRQLWAESLGKNGFGSTPINSMGTVDQHSQLQLYLEGPKDKFFTFINLEKNPADFLIKDLADCKTLFGGKKLSKIHEIERKTTIEVLRQKKLPIRIFNLKKMDEESLGCLMMQMFIETILVAYFKNISPFDQPAVELRKNLAKKMLSSAKFNSKKLNNDNVAN
jgi:glucose-6-phosphate isomerase